MGPEAKQPVVRMSTKPEISLNHKEVEGCLGGKVIFGNSGESICSRCGSPILVGDGEEELKTD